MRTYVFHFRTDNHSEVEYAVKSHRLERALSTFLLHVPRIFTFAHRLEVGYYTVISNGKKQLRRLDCLHTYLLINGKLVRWYEEGVCD